MQDRVVNGHTVDGVSEFIYLGSKQSSHANTSMECVRRIALPAAGVVNVDLDDVMETKRSLSLHTKFRLYSACVMTVLLYGCETWTLNKRICAGLRSKHFICDVNTESSQSSGMTSSRMLQWPPHLAWTVSST